MRLLESIKYRYDVYKIQDYKNIQGYLHMDEAISLYRIAERIGRNKHILEIGSWKGKSTVCIAKGAKQGTTVTCIDPFNAVGEEGSDITYQNDTGKISLREQFEQNLNERKLLSKVNIYQGFSDDFVDKVGALNFLFIDGDHSKEQTLKDYENYGSKITAGGYLAMHDYYPERKDFGPTWVIDNVVLPSGKYVDSRQIGNLWVARKSKE